MGLRSNDTHGCECPQEHEPQFLGSFNWGKKSLWAEIISALCFQRQHFQRSSTFSLQFRNFCSQNFDLDIIRKLKAPRIGESLSLLLAVPEKQTVSSRSSNVPIFQMRKLRCRETQTGASGSLRGVHTLPPLGSWHFSTSEKNVRSNPLIQKLLENDNTPVFDNVQWSSNQLWVLWALRATFYQEGIFVAFIVFAVVCFLVLAQIVRELWISVFHMVKVLDGRQDYQCMQNNLLEYDSQLLDFLKHVLQRFSSSDLASKQRRRLNSLPISF